MQLKSTAILAKKRQFDTLPTQGWGKVGARSWVRSGQGWGKVEARFGQKARLGQGLGRQGLGNVGARSGHKGGDR